MSIRGAWGRCLTGRRRKDVLAKAPLSYPEATKRRIETDLLFLARDILKYRKGENPAKPEEGICDPPDYIHARMARLDARPERFHMGHYSRETYKTTILTISKAIQLLCIDPNNTILIVNATGHMARRFLSEIKRHLEYNETLIQLYGKFKGKSDWRTDYINIAQRTTSVGMKEPSIATGGVDTGVTGSHPKYILLDDIVCRENITTADQKMKVIDYVDKTIPLVGTEGHVYVVGTPWAYDDVYQYMRDKWLPVRSANGESLFAYDCMGILDENEVPVMPSKWGLAQIKEKRDSLPMLDFSAQYLCNPRAGGNTMVKPEDILTYQTPRLDKDDNYEVYISIDPAISLNPKKCYTGIICGIPRPPNYLYIDDAYRLKVLPQDIINKVMDLIDKYKGHVRVVGVEDTQFQRIYNASLLDKIREKMYKEPDLTNIWVKPLKAIDSKHNRIFALEPYFRQHQIFIKEGTGNDGLYQLLYQVNHYPNLGETNLDCIDALAYQLQLLPPSVLNSSYNIINARNASIYKSLDVAVYNPGPEAYAEGPCW